MRHRRIRKIGEPYMPLPQDYARGVLFVGRKPVGKRPKVVATAFLVGVEPWHPYVVTAAHVVEGIDDTFVRIRMADGSFQDEPVPDWVPHGKHDVAVAPIDLPEGNDLIATGLDQFIDAEEDAEEGYSAELFGEIELGDPIYFIGLLAGIRSMTERNVPIVRTGFLGALMQDDVPVQRPGEAVKHITAHLIDCRSFSGFSGSPAYLQKSRTRGIRLPQGAGLSDEHHTALLGLIGGHFDEWTRTKTRSAISEVEVEEDDTDAYQVSDDTKSRVSTGVGYVIPAEFIRETLMKKELIDMRQEKDDAEEAAAAREESESAAEEDSIRTDEPEYDRFEDLTRQLVNTPKPKPDEDKS